MAASNDTAEVREVIDAQAAALSAKKAQEVIGHGTRNTVVFSLAPPLVAPAGGGTAGLEAWFATWKGPIGYDRSRLAITAEADLAIAYGLARMTGEKIDGARVDLWFRETLALRKVAGAWKIFHQHSSVPFYMDGSFRAAVDLGPPANADFEDSSRRA